MSNVYTGYVPIQITCFSRFVLHISCIYGFILEKVDAELACLQSTPFMHLKHLVHHAT